MRSTESARDTPTNVAGALRTRVTCPRPVVSSSSVLPLEQRPTLAVAGLDLELAVEHDADLTSRSGVRLSVADVVRHPDEHEFLHPKGLRHEERWNNQSVRRLRLLDVAEPRSSIRSRDDLDAVHERPLSASAPTRSKSRTAQLRRRTFACDATDKRARPSCGLCIGVQLLTTRNDSPTEDAWDCSDVTIEALSAVSMPLAPQRMKPDVDPLGSQNCRDAPPDRAERPAQISATKPAIWGAFLGGAESGFWDTVRSGRSGSRRYVMPRFSWSGLHGGDD